MTDMRTARTILFWVFMTAPLLCTAAPGTVTYNLSDPSEPWRRSQSGISTSIMPPYTALARNGKSVNCWGRSYDLGAVFPASVTSQGQKLLERPMVLRIKTGRKWTEVAGLYPSFGLERADRMEFAADLNMGDLAVSATSWIEYDGLMRVDLKLAPPESAKPVQLEALELTVPFVPEASIFYHTETLWGRHVYERSPTIVGATVSYDWQPLIWVGNHDVGLTVVTETRDGWSSTKDAIDLRRTKDSLDLTLHIVTKPVQISDARMYTFGLQATPVKEMRPDRWNIVIGTLPEENLRSLGPVEPFEPFFSYPQPKDFPEVHKRIAELKKRGIRSCYYITTSATSEKTEVNKRHHDEWLISKAIFGGGEWKVSKGLIGASSCCPASSFSDFMAWAVENVMNTFDVEGIYIDNPGPYRCENALHGCGRGGVETHPYFALRDLHKRIYTIVKTRKPNGFVWEHTSQRFNSLQMSWLDIYSGGEHFRETKAFPRKQLEQMINRTYLDITATGYQMGVVPVFLSSLTVRADRKEGEWSDWLLSRLLPYGQLVWAHHGWMDASSAIAVSRARADFGLGREAVRFYRPHELPKWLAINSPQPVIACLWQRDRDKAVMIVLSNWTENATLARLSRNDIMRQFGPVTLRDALTRVTIPNEHMMIAIPAKSFRVLTISSQ
jgi:hypothetical protein